MKLSDTIGFLRLVGVGEITVSDDGEWARCKCPLAPVFHAKGTDNNPSFGVRINDDGESGFHCFTCKSGRLSDLIHIMNFTTGIRKDACSFYGSKEIFEYDTKDEKTSPIKHQSYKDVHAIPAAKPISRIPIPDRVLRHYPLLETSPHKIARQACIDYMESRNISEETLFKFSVRHNPWRRDIAFALYGDSRNVYGLHFKPVTDEKGEFRFWHLTPKNAGYPELEWGSPDAMFGMQFYTSQKPLLFVESETDVLNLHSLGLGEEFCIIGSCGAVNQVKIDRFRNTTFILGFDADPAGSKYYKKCLSLIPRDKIIVKLDWSIIGLKDAGDLRSIKQFQEVYEKRRVIGMDFVSVKSYSDVWKTTNRKGDIQKRQESY